MTLLYLRYPGIARAYFVFEMITNMQESFLMMWTQNDSVNVLYTYLMINYLIYANYDFITNMTAACIYMTTFIYAQTILFPSESFWYTLQLNIAHALTAAVAMVFI